VRYVVCRATEPADVLDVLREELLGLAQADPQLRDTTLLILPDAFVDFVDFNDFLYSADKALRKLKLDGELQSQASTLNSSLQTRSPMTSATSPTGHRTRHFISCVKPVSIRR